MENGVDKTLQVQLQVAVQGEDVTIHIKWDDQTERARASFQYQDVQHLSGYIDEILDGEEDEGEDEHDDDFEPPEKARHYPSSPPLPLQNQIIEILHNITQYSTVFARFVP